MKGQSILGTSRARFADLVSRASRFRLIIAALAGCAMLPTNAGACGPSPNPGRIAVLPASLLGVQRPMQAADVLPKNVLANSSDADPSIVGLWNITFYSGGQIFDQGFDQWHSDGTEALNDNAAPQPANGAGTVCLGVYKKVGPRTYSLRHPFWVIDANGNLAGSGFYLEKITVDPGGDSYVGTFTFETFDVAGNQTFQATGTVAAQRITVDD